MLDDLEPGDTRIAVVSYRPGADPDGGVEAVAMVRGSPETYGSGDDDWEGGAGVWTLLQDPIGAWTDGAVVARVGWLDDPADPEWLDPHGGPPARMRVMEDGRAIGAGVVLNRIDPSMDDRRALSHARNADPREAWMLADASPPGGSGAGGPETLVDTHATTLREVDGGDGGDGGGVPYAVVIGKSDGSWTVACPRCGGVHAHLPGRGVVDPPCDGGAYRVDDSAHSEGISDGP